MTPNYSPFPNFLIDLNEEDHNQQIFISNSQQELASSSCSSNNYSNPLCTNYPIFINPVKESEGYNYHTGSHPIFCRHEANMYSSHSGSFCDRQTLKNPEDDYGLNLSLCKKLEDHENRSETNNNNISMNCMPSKVRLKKKMIENPDRIVVEAPHDQTSTYKYEGDKKKQFSSIDGGNSSSKNYSSIMINSNNTIRVCSDCNTTKTPLWRSGPKGPKSLCNACGIRQRKARRAAMVAAAGDGGSTIFDAPKKPTMKKKVQQRETQQMNNNNNSHLPIKKRCKFTCEARSTCSKKNKKRSKLCFDELAIILSKNSAFERVFHQDEKEGAILLMALSYGVLVHGQKIK